MRPPELGPPDPDQHPPARVLVILFGALIMILIPLVWALSVLGWIK